MAYGKHTLIREISRFDVCVHIIEKTRYGSVPSVMLREYINHLTPSHGKDGIKVEVPDGMIMCRGWLEGSRYEYCGEANVTRRQPAA